MPDVTAVRPGRWALAAVTLMIAAGCTVGSVPQSRATETPSTPVATRGAPGPSMRPTAVPSATNPPAASATPIPDLGSAGPVPLARVLLVCELWGEDPPPTAIGCRDGASLALAALGPDRASGVNRLDVAFGSSCSTSGACLDRRPDVVVVTARVGSLANAATVRVARDPTGELTAWPATAVDLPPDPPLDPPPAAAPAIDGATAAIRDREPLPFCGDEDATAGTFDTVARQCFLDGIRAGIPVELISRSASTEGDPVLTLYRWTGTGSVAKAVRNAAGWEGAVCAITPIATDAVFVLAGGCDPRDP